MTKSQHYIYFFTVLGICLLLIFTLKVPYRNFVSLVWALLAVLPYFISYYLLNIKLGRVLITQYSEDLNRLKVGHSNTRFKQLVNTFELYNKRKELSALADEIEEMIIKYFLYLRLSFMGFLGFGILSVITVVLTW